MTTLTTPTEPQLSGDQTPRGPAPRAGVRTRRPTSPLAHGEPMVWVMGAALVICLAAIISLLSLIVIEGARTFWPRAIHRVTLNDGSTLVGMPIREDVTIRGEAAVGNRLYRVGNRDVDSEAFRWVPIDSIASIETPEHALLLERTAWGVFIGKPRAAMVQETLTPAAGAALPPEPTAIDGRPVIRVERSEPAADGSIVQRSFLAEGPANTAKLLNELIPEATQRRDLLRQLNDIDLGSLNADIEGARLAIRRAEIEHERTKSAAPALLAWPLAALVMLTGAGLIFASIRVNDTQRGQGLRKVAFASARTLAGFAGAALVLLALLENPLAVPRMSAADLDTLRARKTAIVQEAEAAYEVVRVRMAEIDAFDRRYRLVVEDAQGRIAPVRQSEPTQPMLVSQIVRAVPANELSFVGKLGVYFSRWGEFLSDDPRDANTEGGVFPVIFGTVLLTILLSIVVVPLGVVAAIYLREYARQGVLVSVIRIAINNLAGVPSIVYGVFGLGFFCYTVGAYVDQGPADPMGRASWWGSIAVVVIIAASGAAALSISSVAKSDIGTRRSRAVGGLLWILAASAVLWIIAGTPYFGGFFVEKLPSPTFGGRGLLWAALTLALLTLPVVIVATEEAIAAVPRTVREGSYGCGASKWQTIRRIVLPQALPGIMTGAILAMARGAGEVAPLMLVGAVKLAPELPISSDFPFLHPERSFMHLGFHIFDLGFQSPDSEAARPLVWTTTLLLIVIVLTLNLGAVIVRARLRAKVINASV